MATQSATPPNPTDETSQAPEVVQPVTGNQLDANADPAKGNTVTSVFVNPEPIREDQVQNAVKFLSHPKVRGSPVIHRRSFLERKGLTKEEIDEAFRRVPDPPPPISTAPQTVTKQDGQLQPSSFTQPQASTQAVQPVGGVPKMGTLTFLRFHWSQALLAVGLLAISGAGTAVLFEKAFVPRLKSWIRKVVLEDEDDLVKKTDAKPSLAEEAAAAAKAAAAAAADVARASQEMLISKTEEKKYFGELTNLLDVQVQETRSLSNLIRKLEGDSKLFPREDNRVLLTSSRPSYANGKAGSDSHSARSLSPPPSLNPSAVPRLRSYMEEIVDVPPNLDQPASNFDRPASNPGLASRPKPWEAGSSSYGLQSQEIGDSANSFNFLNQSNADNSVPWWQRRNVRITEIESNNSEAKAGYSERQVQRSWVPPQLPSVAMPEAAAAIWQPNKSTFREEQLTDDQLLARSSELTDELQSVTKLAESGGALLEANGGTPVLPRTTSAGEMESKEENALH